MDYLAIDLGASNGRAIIGSFTNEKIQLVEAYRFNNKPIKVNDTLYWDILFLFDQIKTGIKAAFQKGYNIQGLAIDTWGVDFGFVDLSGSLIANPVCYRDERTKGMQTIVSEIISAQELYSRTGIQQLDINTLYQLFSLTNKNSPLLTIAHKLLFTPDIFNYFLTGVMANEYTIASTSQLLNAQSKEWDFSLFQQLGLSPDWMNKIQQPGSLVGSLQARICEELNIPPIKVFSIGSHDTASAIGALPLDKDMAFLSSGTWSLLGIPLEEPILSEKARSYNFSNEGGVNNQILFMRNITGLWLFQQLISEWKDQDNSISSYEILLEECKKTAPFRSIIDSDDLSFNNPVSMQYAIEDYCSKSHQPIPSTRGEFIRCILESLALKYYRVMENLKESTKRDIQKLFIAGGGSQNKLLNQFISNALNMEVITGLTEATAIGNLIQQAIANNELNNFEEAHSVIKNSFNFVRYFPENHELWRKEINRIP